MTNEDNVLSTHKLGDLHTQFHSVTCTLRVCTATVTFQSRKLRPRDLGDEPALAAAWIGTGL